MENFGSITADVGIEISSTFLTNRGAINGGTFGILWNENAELDISGSLEVFNYGVISGEIAIHGSDLEFLEFDSFPPIGDRIINDGSIIGAVELGDGADRYFGSEGSLEGTLSLGSGNDTAQLGTGDDIVMAGAGRDIVSGGDGADEIVGGGGDDVIFGEAGDDRLIGGGGDDRLVGNEGNDWLLGGAGDDRIGGWAGNDVLVGGSGADVFVFGTGSGDDTIRDFEIGVDQIDLSDLATNYGAVLAAASEVGGSVVIDMTALGGSGTLRIVDVLEADLSAGDFLF